MPLKLAAPLTETFVLERSDELVESEGDPTVISIRQASQGEYERRQQMFSEWSRGFDPISGEERVVQRLNVEMLKRLEVYLTLSDCNIQDEKGKALFKFRNDRLAMSELEFNRAWAKLPLVTANEIHACVLKVNKTWDGSGEAL